jgi:hypothetical protein
MERDSNTRDLHVTLAERRTVRVLVAITAIRVQGVIGYARNICLALEDFELHVRQAPKRIVDK